MDIISAGVLLSMMNGSCLPATALMSRCWYRLLVNESKSTYQFDVLYFATFHISSGTPPSQLTIALGAQYTDEEVPGELSIPAKKIINHPQGDITLIQLSRRVTFSKTISPLCLAESGEELTKQTGSDCWVTGWGATACK